MLPLLIVGGVIGAVVSAVQGGSWLSDQVTAANSSASAGGKGTPQAQSAAKESPFEAALAAQAAGQSLPTSTGGVAAATALPPSAAIVPATHGPDYDTLARMKAGIAAYSHVGQHRGSHTGTADDQPVSRS